jgi:thioesterase domain-containing protein
MQTRGSDGLEAPCERVEEFAEFHLEVLQQAQSHGPYILIGYSFGGLVAFEMARRLADLKEHVALLVLIDSYPHWQYAPWEQRAKIFGRELMERGSRAAAAVFGRSLLSAVTSQKENSGLASRPPLGISFTPAMSRVQECTHGALERYLPYFYSGKIKFVRAKVSLHFPDNPAKIWGKLAKGIEVETVPGDHLEILSMYPGHLAAVLSRYLAEIPDTSVQRP